MTQQQFYQDATVYDTVGEKIGTLHAYDPEGGYITVQKGFLFHKDLYIPVDAAQSTDADGNVHLSVHKDDLADSRYDNPPPPVSSGGVAREDSYAQRATVAETVETMTPMTHTQAAPPRRDQATVRTDDTINVPVFEEELVVGTQREEMGRVHLRKDVVTEQQSIPMTLRHEEVTVERVAVTGQTSEADLTNAFQDQTFEVKVMGEEAIVGKQAHVVEEVRLHKDVTQQQEQITDTVRKERVIVDGVDTTPEQGRPRRRR